ncbi:response regulator transcription factor [Chitinophaga nivalis]|uniref:Response regulator transcription factor n=1 Tax=Chitinophaga nivalis TaxID=2991709 RepID=A0ABT3IN19_9BACT|nr:response regulator transcription factor [Chitinophaga nivalis]MCW3465007.1 response regulator transcription factor [Chitinophaga nivalis]MCW3485301.1 response regulator transcription factor [Chitinophaga nivalis]
MKHNIQVGLVEDQFLFREGMKAIIGTWEGMEVVFESADGYSVLERLKNAPAVPDVMLVDLSLPPDGEREYSGQQVTEDVTAAFPEMKILILSVHDDEHFINQLIHCGAHGYLVKDSAPQEVEEAINAVYHKGSYINERALKALQLKTVRKIKQKPANLVISKREEEILQLVCKQYTAEEIAQELFISVKTVNGHRNNLLQKTGSRNVTGLVLYAIRNNIVSLT